MKPGTRVTVQGRAGVVKALRPGNSVDVQFDGESFTTRQDGSHVRPFRENPGPRGGLTPSERESLPTSVFALPGRRFPINDANHGRIALQYILAGRVAERDVNTVVQAVLDRWGRNREVMAFYNKHKAKLTRQNVERIHGRRMAANPAGEVYDPAKEQFRSVVQGVYESLVRKELKKRYNEPFVSNPRGHRLDASLDADTKRRLLSSAYAIATSQGQRHGDLIPGTQAPTAKGIQRSAARLLDPSQRKHAEENRQDYELTLAGARKSGHYRVVAEAVNGQTRYVVQPRPPAGLVQIPAYRMSADKAQEDADLAKAAYLKALQSVKGRANPYYLHDVGGYARGFDIEDEPAEGIVGEGIEVGHETYQSLADRLGVSVDILMKFGTVTLPADEGRDAAGRPTVIPEYVERLVRYRPAGAPYPKARWEDTVPKYMRGGTVSKSTLVKAFEKKLRDDKGNWNSTEIERYATRAERDEALKPIKAAHKARDAGPVRPPVPHFFSAPQAPKVSTEVPRTWAGPATYASDERPYSSRLTAIPTESQVAKGKEALAQLTAKAEEERRIELREAEQKSAAIAVARDPVAVDKAVVDAVYAQLKGRPGYGIVVDEGYSISVYVPPRIASIVSVSTFLSRSVRPGPRDKYGNATIARPDLKEILVRPLEELVELLEKAASEDPAAYGAALSTVKAAIVPKTPASALPTSALGLGPKSIFQAPVTAAESLIRQLQYAAPVIDRDRMITASDYDRKVGEETRKLIEAFKAENNVTQVPNRTGRALDKKARDNVELSLSRRKLGKQEVGALKLALEAQMAINDDPLMERYVETALKAPLPPIALTPAEKRAIETLYPGTEKAEKKKIRESQEDKKKAGALDWDITRPFWDVESHVDETGKQVVRYVLFVPSTIAYLSQVKRELGRVELENESAFTRDVKGVTSEDANMPAIDENIQLQRLRSARASGDFIELAEAESALARLNQAKQAKRSKESLMAQTQARDKSQRIRAAERVSLFVLPPPTVISAPGKYGATSFATTEVITEAEGWMEDVQFTRQRQAEQMYAKKKEERVSGALAGYSKFYTTSPLLAFYTIMLWNTPELFTGFDLGLPSEHEEDGKKFWRNISIGPVTSPQNTWLSPLYGYYAALAQLALLQGDLALALLEKDTKRAAENIIDIDGVSDLTSPVQMGLRGAVIKLGNGRGTLPRRPVGEPEFELKRLESAIKSAEEDLAMGTVKQEDIAFTRQFITEMRRHRAAEQKAIMTFDNTELAELMRGSGAGVQGLVADAVRLVSAKIRPLLEAKKRKKKNPYRSFR